MHTLPVENTNLKGKVPSFTQILEDIRIHPGGSKEIIFISHCCPQLSSLESSAAAAAAKSLQLCLTLCDSINHSPPGSPIPGILQARTLEWVAISFSNAWKWKVKVKSVVSDTSRPHGLQPTRLLCSWNFPGKSTGVGCHRLLHYYRAKWIIHTYTYIPSFLYFFPT